jgi:hypothetical protein
MPRYWLSQMNVARALASPDSPQLADFMELLDPVNALADAAPGFVWRLQTEDGNATALRVLGDDMMMVNMSVWESLDALGSFVHNTRHRDVMRRRREWFERLAEAYMVLWWVEAGRLPSVAEGEERLLHLRRFGPTPHAFTFKDPQPAPDRVGPTSSR